MPPRPFVLHEANYRQLREYRPAVAVLPWGATEAHNYHLPHGTDVIEATVIAERAAAIAHEAGARVVVLPTIPYGNDAQQLDQVATISLRTTTALAILADVARSLKIQGIDRLVLLNAHHEPIPFKLPRIRRVNRWEALLDTAQPVIRPHRPVRIAEYPLDARSVVVLRPVVLQATEKQVVARVRKPVKPR